MDMFDLWECVWFVLMPAVFSFHIIMPVCALSLSVLVPGIPSQDSTPLCVQSHVVLQGHAYAVTD